MTLLLQLITYIASCWALNSRILPITLCWKKEGWKNYTGTVLRTQTLIRIDCDINLVCGQRIMLLTQHYYGSSRTVQSLELLYVFDFTNVLNLQFLAQQYSSEKQIHVRGFPLPPCSPLEKQTKSDVTI